jgi:hypothetical protein
MDAEIMQNYLRRWEAVEKIEKREACSTTVEMRWQQINTLAGLAAALGIMPLEDRCEDDVRARWNRLKAACP